MRFVLPKALPLALFRCARFDPAGVAMFGDTPDAFLVSLAPLLFMPLLSTLLATFAGGGRLEWTMLMASVVLLLSTAVLSHWFARRWGREAVWARYACAINWCLWVVLAAWIAVLLGAVGLATLGFGPAVELSLAVMTGYALCLQIFIARQALAISLGRAILLTLCVNIVPSLLVGLPMLWTGTLMLEG
jgi:hypothetical protein